MPNGRPGDHPLTDITVHRILTYSRRADSLIRKLNKLISPEILWKLPYLLERDGKMIHVQGTEKRIPIKDFENMPAGLLDTAEELAKRFDSVEKKIKRR
jgi:hypothetical protein